MIGEQLDNYRVVEKIGEGGMGTVYRATDVMLERDVALKFLRPELAAQRDLVERFRAEAIVLARLNHPNIAAIHGLHRHGQDLFMAMEFVPGLTLDSVLTREGRLPASRACQVGIAVLSALEYAHRQGVVHRDIKSANIILTPEGQVKVMDFGIARVLGTQRQTRVGFAVGTLAYMSPEQIQGLEVDGRSDLYSAGIVVYEMLAGRTPFEGDTEWRVMQAQISAAPPALGATDASAELEEVVMRALSKAPDARFQSATEFRRALRASSPTQEFESGAFAPITGASPAPGTPGTAPHEAATVLRATPAWGVRAAARDAAAAPTAAATPAAPWPAGAGTLAGGGEPAREAAEAPEPRGTATTRPPIDMAASQGSTPSAPTGHGRRRAQPPRPLMVAGAVLVLVGAVLFGWLAFGGGAEKARETAGLIVGHVVPPPPPSPDSPPAQPAAIPVPVPPPTPDIPQAPGPFTSGASPAASRPAPSKIPSVGSPGAASPAATAPEPVTLTNVSSPVRPPESPANATAAIVRFGKVKLAGEGRAPRETDVILQLEGTRVALFDRDGRTLVRTLDYQKITGATYSQKERGGFLGLGTRHWLRLDAAAGTMLLRLDKGNQAQIIEAFERLTGHQVVRDRTETR